jgi:siroheme synthase-like protein
MVESSPAVPAEVSGAVPVEPSRAVAVYPVFLRLDGRRVLLVGGGRVASAKLPALLEAGACVTVVAPAIGTELKQAAASTDREGGDVQLVERPFEPADLDGASFVVAAAPPGVNRAVADAAELRGLFVNAVDDAASASALLGGVVRRGGVTVAVSTGGRAPALAGLLREALEAVLPDDLAKWVEVGERVRAGWKRNGLPLKERRPLLLKALQDLYTTSARSQRDAQARSTGATSARSQRDAEAPSASATSARSQGDAEAPSAGNGPPAKEAR